jgi:hypothetical protein
MRHDGDAAELDGIHRNILGKPGYQRWLVCVCVNAEVLQLRTGAWSISDLLREATGTEGLASTADLQCLPVIRMNDSKKHCCIPTHVGDTYTSWNSPGLEAAAAMHCTCISRHVQNISDVYDTCYCTLSCMTHSVVPHATDIWSTRSQRM